MPLGFPVIPAIQNAMPQLVWPAYPLDADFFDALGEPVDPNLAQEVWAELLVHDVAGTVTSLGQLQGSRCLLVLPQRCGLVSESGAIQWLDDGTASVSTNA